MGSRAFLCPRQTVQASFDRGPQQVVPCRMKHYFVTTVALAIMGVQDRQLLVGVKTPALDFLGPQEFSQLGELRLGPACAFAAHSFSKRTVAQEKVIACERRDLVQGCVTSRRRDLCWRFHDSDGLFRFNNRVALRLQELSHTQAPKTRLAQRPDGPCAARFHFSSPAYSRKL